MTRAGIPALSDQELAALAQRGDSQAYGELVCRLWKGVANVVYRMCGNEQMAEEATQEAFLRAWQHLSSFRPERNVRSWIYRIAVNAAIDALRRERPSVGTDDLAFSSPEPGPETTIELSERASAIRRAVLSLSPTNRSALVLREYAGLSYTEIAAALNIPLGTVMSRLSAARAQLRQALASLLEEE